MKKLYRPDGCVTHLGNEAWNKSANELANHILSIKKQTNCSMAEAIMLTLDTVGAAAQQAINQEANKNWNCRKSKH